MKKIIVLPVLLLFFSCVGKIEDIKLSTNNIVFTPEESSYVVTSDIELVIDVVNENDSSRDVPSTDDSRPRYEGEWITVTDYGTAILIEVSENKSEEIRYALISLRNGNNIGQINITQQKK